MILLQPILRAFNDNLTQVKQAVRTAVSFMLQDAHWAPQIITGTNIASYYHLRNGPAIVNRASFVACAPIQARVAAPKTVVSLHALALSHDQADVFVHYARQQHP